jgi:DNA mismatch endonuclease (patch repair protein)
MVDSLSPSRRSWNMGRIRGANTLPERRLRSQLHRRGLRFRLHDRKLPGSPDIVLPRFKSVIFVHGCFWHRHAGCRNATSPSTRKEFWEKKFQDNVRRDSRNQRALRRSGWRVLVVWECQIAKNESKVAEKVIRAVTSNRE